MRKSKFTLLLTLVLSIAAISFIGFGAERSENVSNREDRKSDVVKITILSTNDVHGHIFGRGSHRDLTPENLGGFPLLASYRDAIERARDRVFLFDAGDIMQGTWASAGNEGAEVIRWFNLLDYDAAALGNHEFDFGPIGPDELADAAADRLGAIRMRVDEAEFPFLAANVTDNRTGKSLAMDNLERVHVFEANGVQVAVIGLSTTDTPVTTNPVNVMSIDFTGYDEVIADLCPKLREGGADVIVVLGHLGCYETAGETGGELWELASRTPREYVDVFIGGHTHRVITRMIDGKALMEAGSYGAGFCRVDIDVDSGTGEIVSLEMPEFRSLSRPASAEDSLYENIEIVPDALLASALLDLGRQFRERDTVICELPEAIEANRSSLEVPLGNLVTDALISRTGADFAFVNPGGLRASFDAGPLNESEIYEALPFDNKPVVLSMTGAQIRAVVRQGFERNSYPIALQLAGGKIVARRAGERLEFANLLLPDGTPVEDEKTYKVCTLDFLHNGGDGFTLFGECEIEQTHEIYLRDLLAAYLRSADATLPPAGGRIVVE
ncbi:MAG: bifunctional metallophosphatase/5'-nucleotidase [Planctomycetes bacterium]|nr:bifunctional metallophosphatase/5'-nucleotidase [Planctomycetota bacterium]